AVILAGIIQVIMGFVRAGEIANYFPSSVIHGMLAGIGILIFLKQIPHALGYDKVPEGDDAFIQSDNENTFSELINMLNFIQPSIIIITGVSLFILLIWQSKFIQKVKVLSFIPGPLLAVVSGIVLNLIFSGSPDLALSKDHLVALPVASSAQEFFSNFTLPDFSAFTNPAVYS